MDNSLFYNHIEENDNNKRLIQEIEEFAKDNPSEQIYLLTAPLGENNYSYDYEENVIVILSPKHRIIFLDLKNGEKKEEFDYYCEDFLDDLHSISDKYKYKKHIGRPRQWQNVLTKKVSYNNDKDISTIMNDNKINKDNERKNELLISLVIGSINDIEKIGIEVPSSVLEKIKHNIILFDGEQTRFIYKELDKKRISIQGLSGTGKTELLLHKLKEIYSSSSNYKTFFTCHNIALANTLKNRVPDFFDFMKVEKQIKWNEQIWVDRAWGSQKDKNSGLYTYLCHFYGLAFSRWNRSTTYEDIFSKMLESLNEIEDDDFIHALDYILIDERQDFPDVFFDVCEKVAKNKIYIAGDIFQDIFEDNIEKRVINVDFILNKCYRTDPKILMFAHAIGMGLFEEEKFNWLSDLEWKASGYKVTKEGRNISLTRDAIRRFEDLEDADVTSMNISKYTSIDQIINILQTIIEKHPTVKPHDIAIIIIDDNKTIYEYVDQLESQVKTKLKMEVNKAYESKGKRENELFISNRNNVKGLEFPFVICVTAKIRDDYRYRNSLYTMLTRSFLQSFLLVQDESKLDLQLNGLSYINDENCIKTIEPTKEEKDEIQNNIIKLKEESNISYSDFLTEIFNELKIDSPCRKKLEKPIFDAIKDKFDRELIIDFINSNKKFYCQ
jgi:superfamily I DNA and RNA helicase